MLKRMLVFGLGCGLLAVYAGCCGYGRCGMLNSCGEPPCYGGGCGAPCEADCGPPCGDDCGSPCGSCGVGPIRGLLGRLFCVEAWCGPSCGERYWGECGGQPDGCDSCGRGGNWNGGGGCSNCNGGYAYRGAARRPAYEADAAYGPDGDVVAAARAPSRPQRTARPQYQYQARNQYPSRPPRPMADEY
jgi:hypothetical protein